MSEATAPAAIPDGFVPLNVGGLFIAQNGPLYVKLDGPDFIVGFRVEQRHTNPAGMCHGGMLMSFVDMQLPIGARYQAKLDDRFLPTINLSADFLAPAPLGSWVQGRTQVLKVTRNMVFAQAIVTADDVVTLRANGIFKLGKPMEHGTIDFSKIFASE